MLYVELGAEGNARHLQYAPYLDYRPLKTDEPKIEAILLRPECAWISRDLEQNAQSHAVANVVPEHLTEVRSRKLELIAKTEVAVKDRLTKEITYWDHRAQELKYQEQAGRPNARLNSDEARKRADALQGRLEKRMEELKLERQISALPPVILGGFLVVPMGLLAAMTGHSMPKAASSVTGQGPLAERASKKLRNDALLYTSYAGTLLKMELDRVPLWRGDDVSIQQLQEDYARYLYLPRLRQSEVLFGAIRDGLGLLTWSQDSFAYADSFDEALGRYRGLRCGQIVNVSRDNSSGLLVKPEIALKQREAETKSAANSPAKADGKGGIPPEEQKPSQTGGVPGPRELPKPRRYHGSVDLDPARVGRDAGRVADEVIAHLAGLVGTSVRVTLEIQADVPNGAPDNVVRTVTENSRTLKFLSYGFEDE